MQIVEQSIGFLYMSITNTYLQTCEKNWNIVLLFLKKIYGAYRANIQKKYFDLLFHQKKKKQKTYGT